MSKINMQKIVDALTKRNDIELHTADSGVQWITNGEAMFPLYGFPRFTAESFACTFGVERARVGESESLDFLPDLSDVASCENLIQLEPVQLQPFDEAHISFVTMCGTAFVPERYVRLMPSEMHSGVYERSQLETVTQTGDGFSACTTVNHVYIVFKDGMKLCGIITPKAVKLQLSQQWLDMLAETFARISKMTIVPEGDEG